MATGRWFVRLAGWSGVIGPFAVSALLLAAISVSPWFSWTDNALSDLGVSGSGAVLFNTALIMGGSLLVVFAMGLWEGLNGRFVRVGVLLTFLDGLMLGAIGVFPETAGQVHLYVSVAFFALLSLSLLVFGLTYLLKAEIRRGLACVLLGVFSASVWLFGWEGVAIPEALAYLSGAAWWVAIGLTVLSRGAETPIGRSLSAPDVR